MQISLDSGKHPEMTVHILSQIKAVKSCKASSAQLQEVPFAQTMKGLYKRKPGSCTMWQSSNILNLMRKENVLPKDRYMATL